MNGLQLRPLVIDDEVQFMAAHYSFLPDDFTFALGYQKGISWIECLDLLKSNRLSTEVSEEQVPATFLVADVAGKIVGRTSIRHELNAFLAHEGGHIGFVVVPEERRRGYATEILLRAFRSQLVSALTESSSPATRATSAPRW
jgi:predicted acetyltransferase